MMAFHARKSTENEFQETHDINVTPFIDVMLVLLIVFMVAAPLATVSIPVDLPNSTAAAKTEPEKPVFLTVKSDLQIILGEEAVPDLQQLPKMLKLAVKDPQQRIYLRADQSLAYSEVMKVINHLNRAGYQQIALVGIDSLD